MAATKTSHHTRSISLPSTYHPLEASFEDHFRRLRASQAGTSTSSSLCERLCNMKDLYDQLNSSIQLPDNQHLKNTEVEEILDGSIALLDASSVVLEALPQMKQSIIDLESALHRGNNKGVQAYVKSRKNIIKALSKCLVNLKKVEKYSASTQSENSDITVTVLKEAEAISFSTLKSLLSNMIGKKAVSQTRGWSLVAKLVKSKASFENNNEVEIIDHSLCSGAESKVVFKQLKTLEMTVHELENGLESVSRCFVETRVSLLNVLTH